ncbi:MAG: hypothetical protein HC869_11815 [Rhodospirillales bacterium]|nr:hypothetical protein [Rhodospirillales bacterium]
MIRTQLFLGSAAVALASTLAAPAFAAEADPQAVAITAQSGSVAVAGDGGCGGERVLCADTAVRGAFP